MIELKPKKDAGKIHTHPFLGGFSLKVFVHVPVALPLPAVRGQLEAVQRLVLQSCDITPLPTVAWQQAIRESINWIPPLTKSWDYSHG